MSLEIDCAKINGVLLADGWHEVLSKNQAKAEEENTTPIIGDPEISTFSLDAYEFVSYLADGDDPYKEYSAGDHINTNPTGVTWREKGKTQMFCPITSIIAVRYGTSIVRVRSRYTGNYD